MLLKIDIKKYGKKIFVHVKIQNVKKNIVNALPKD